MQNQKRYQISLTICHLSPKEGVNLIQLNVVKFYVSLKYLLEKESKEEYQYILFELSTRFFQEEDLNPQKIQNFVKIPLLFLLVYGVLHFNGTNLSYVSKLPMPAWIRNLMLFLEYQNIFIYIKDLNYWVQLCSLH